MIPLRLRISGFLSYREPVEIDFTTFDLACISGHNGAGKSSLLDAMTWALFGQARRKDEAIINLQSKAAEVALTFQYEDDIYRVQRALPRGKTTILEFQVLDSAPILVQEVTARRDGGPTPIYQLPPEPKWRPLTERTMRETQACIEETLRLDYDTFVNASFFLQGKADQFTQQNASRRKEVLGNILGLEVWETYRSRAGERRKRFEEELNLTDRRIEEIDQELGEADARKQRLAELEHELKQLSVAREAQASALESIRRTAASLDEQKKLVATLGDQFGRLRAQLDSLCNRLAEREAARSVDAALVDHADEITAAYTAWQGTVKELHEWDKTASAFHEHEKERHPLLRKIEAEKARLEEEQRGLLAKEKDVANQQGAIKKVQSDLDAAHKLLAQLDAKIKERAELTEQSNAARDAQVRLQAENEALRPEMNELKSRIQALESTSGVNCPVCGQELTPAHRRSTLHDLKVQGKEMGDRFRSNSKEIEQATARHKELETSLKLLDSADVERLRCSTSIAQFKERLENLQRVGEEWESTGKARLKEIEKMLSGEKYAPEERKKLAKVDKHLADIGYDAAAHDRTRLLEQEQRSADEEYRKLSSARAALAPLDSEIASIKSDVSSRQAEVDKLQADHEAARKSLELAQEQAPDLVQAEDALLRVTEQVNRLNQEVGAARQKVTVLDDLRQRKARYQSDRESLALQISQHKALERAFGKDGVPALLIEQALPEIEARANDLLDRLSDSRMSVRFVTQAGYKDKKREDLRETLDIQISDGAGQRDYEMYSGGEAFRVDFAVRLALSEVLARRKGARLQTLVIDEGFGSQDAEGKQRLIEAINLVKNDFAKILVITHLEELKDAFPNRIEIEKTPQGSAATVR